MIMSYNEYNCLINNHDGLESFCMTRKLLKKYSGLPVHLRVLQEHLKNLKRDKNTLMKYGSLIGSLYIKIQKDEAVHLVVRISYHAPNEDFGTEDSVRNAIGFLCIDALSADDEEKIYQIRKKKYPEKLRESGLKDKEDYKKTVEEFQSQRKAKYEYVDLGTEDYSKIVTAIKTFLKNNDLDLYETLNYKDFSLYFEMDYDD